MRILFDNADFVAVDKESGWLAVPSRAGEKENRPIVGRELEKLLQLRIFPVHRLDAEVSGVLLFAKNANAHRDANRVFENHWVRKEYQAFSETPVPAGIALGDAVDWTCRLARGKKRAFEAPHGKDAVTHALCRAEASAAGRTWLDWSLWPRTGRSHQLRYEMYRHQRPILGDELYGSAIRLAGAGIALRAVAIDLTAAHAQGLLKSLPAHVEAPRLPLEAWLGTAGRAS